ncbi:hypothetical protein CsSME_00017375 [Camellia sinensis var. sinensis]
MVELSEYENYAIMMQYCVLGHSLAVKANDFKKELTKKTMEAAKLLNSFHKAEARIRGLLHQAKTIELSLKTAEDHAEAAENIARLLRP